MKKVLVPLAPGFEEIEAVTIIDVLRRAGIEVVVAGTQMGIIAGSRGIGVMPDQLLDQVNGRDFDMLVLPGGAQGVENLKNHPKTMPLLGEFTTSRKMIGAICAAPSLLAAAGLLCGKQVTSHPSVQSKVEGACLYSEERVVVDGKIVTSRGPGTAMEFALKLVELLEGKAKADELKSALLSP